MILPQTREMVRISMLRYLAEAGAHGMRESLLCESICMQFNKRFQREDLANEIHYLVDKDFLAPITKALSPENAVWRITADGRDWVAEQKMDIDANE